MNAPLFERFGGLPEVSRLVLDFYDRVLKSQALRPYFAHADMRRLVEHQAKFIASVMGGPAVYSDADLRDIHGHLEIDDSAFDEMMRLFAEALADFRLPPDEAQHVIAALRARRPHVVKAGAD